VLKLPHHNAAVNIASLDTNIFFNIENNNIKDIKYNER
jgi:hypothetical protein